MRLLGAPAYSCISSFVTAASMPTGKSALQSLAAFGIARRSLSLASLVFRRRHSRSNCGLRSGQSWLRARCLQKNRAQAQCVRMGRVHARRAPRRDRLGGAVAERTQAWHTPSGRREARVTADEGEWARERSTATCGDSGDRLWLAVTPVAPAASPFECNSPGVKRFGFCGHAAVRKPAELQSVRSTLDAGGHATTRDHTFGLSPSSSVVLPLSDLSNGLRSAPFTICSNSSYVGTFCVDGRPDLSAPARLRPAAARDTCAVRVRCVRCVRVLRVRARVHVHACTRWEGGDTPLFF